MRLTSDGPTSIKPQKRTEERTSDYERGKNFFPSIQESSITSTAISCIRPIQRIEDHIDLSDVLGTGYTAAVVAASRRGEDHWDMAAKVIPKQCPRAVASDDYYRRIYEFLPRIRHPNIIRISDVLETATAFCLVMERCCGLDLVETVLEYPLGHFPLCRAKRIFFQLLCGVHHLHKHGLLHRDIKLDNMMYRNKASDEVVLLDFEMSAFMEGRRMNDEDNDDSDDECSLIVGTREYMAPEAHRGRYTPASDMWSCGVVLFVLLDGHFPFDLSRAENDYELQEVLRDPSWWEYALRGVDVEAAALVRQLLSFDDADRMQSAFDALCSPWFLAIHRNPPLFPEFEARIGVQGLHHLCSSNHRAIIGKESVVTAGSKTPRDECNEDSAVTHGEMERDAAVGEEIGCVAVHVARGVRDATARIRVVAGGRRTYGIIGGGLSDENRTSNFLEEPQRVEGFESEALDADVSELSEEASVGLSDEKSLSEDCIAEREMWDCALPIDFTDEEYEDALRKSLSSPGNLCWSTEVLPHPQEAANAVESSLRGSYQGEKDNIPIGGKCLGMRGPDVESLSDGLLMQPSGMMQDASAGIGMHPHTMTPPYMQPHTVMPPYMQPHTVMPPYMQPPTMMQPHTMTPPYMQPHTMTQPPTMMPPYMQPHPMMQPPTMTPPYMQPPTVMQPPTMTPPYMQPPTMMQPHPIMMQQSMQPPAMMQPATAQVPFVQAPMVHWQAPQMMEWPTMQPPSASLTEDGSPPVNPFRKDERHTCPFVSVQQIPVSYATVLTPHPTAYGYYIFSAVVVPIVAASPQECGYFAAPPVAAPWPLHSIPQTPAPPQPQPTFWHQHHPPTFNYYFGAAPCAGAKLGFGTSMLPESQAFGIAAPMTLADTGAYVSADPFSSPPPPPFFDGGR